VAHEVAAVGGEPERAATEDRRRAVKAQVGGIPEMKSTSARDRRRQRARRRSSAMDQMVWLVWRGAARLAK